MLETMIVTLIVLVWLVVRARQKLGRQQKSMYEAVQRLALARANINIAQTVTTNRTAQNRTQDAKGQIESAIQLLTGWSTYRW